MESKQGYLQPPAGPVFKVGDFFILSRGGGWYMGTAVRAVRPTLSYPLRVEILFIIPPCGSLQEPRKDFDARYDRAHDWYPVAPYEIREAPRPWLLYVRI